MRYYQTAEHAESADRGGQYRYRYRAGSINQGHGRVGRMVRMVKRDTQAQHEEEEE